MKLVVSDSGPIHYLVLCGAIEVLPKLYDELLIPPAVAKELTHPNTPPAVSDWIQNLPPWASIRNPAKVEDSSRLGQGEREAVALAIQFSAALLLADDRAARKVAAQKGILVSGTVGVLEQASMRDLLNLRETMKKLLNTNFRIEAEVVQDVLERESARHRPEGEKN